MGPFIIRAFERVFERYHPRHSECLRMLQAFTSACGNDTGDWWHNVSAGYNIICCHIQLRLQYEALLLHTSHEYQLSMILWYLADQHLLSSRLLLNHLEFTLGFRHYTHPPYTTILAKCTRYMISEQLSCSLQLTTPSHVHKGFPCSAISVVLCTSSCENPL